MNALARAEAQIIAIGQANRAWQATLAADSRYQFLIATAVALRPEFDEQDSLDGVVGYHSTSRPHRRRRAILLAEVRKAMLFDGARVLDTHVVQITRARSMERLIASQQAMSTESAEGRIGSTPILAGDALVGRAA